MSADWRRCAGRAQDRSGRRTAVGLFHTTISPAWKPSRNGSIVTARSQYRSFRPGRSATWFQSRRRPGSIASLGRSVPARFELEVLEATYAKLWQGAGTDRRRVVSGKSVSVRVVLGGRRKIKK